MRRLPKFVLALLLSLPLALQAAPAWRTIGHMDIGRAEAPMIEYQNSFYIFNGFSRGIRIVANVGKYTPANNAWEILSTTSTTASKPNAVTHNGIVLVGDSVWLIGGRIGTHPGKVSDQVWIFHIPTRTWSKGPSLPKPFAGGGAALLGNKIHVVGGLDPTALCDVNHHFVYDTTRPAAGWQEITSRSALPQARNHFGTTSIGNKLYVIGGQFGHEHGGLKCSTLAQGAKIVPLAHVYDADTDKWTRLADLPRRRSHTEPSTFVHNGFIYVVGGTRLVGETVLRYNPSNDTWTRLDELALPEKLVAPASRIYNGKLYVLGGGAPLVTYPTTDIRVLDLPDKPVYADNNNPDNGAGDDGSGNTDEAPTPTPAFLKLSAQDLDFGTLSAGGTATRQVQLTNTGEVELTLGELTIEGANAAAFGAEDLSGVRLAAGQSRTLKVTFSASAAGDYQAVLALPHDTDGALSLISLSGAVKTATTTPTPQRSLYRINAGGPALTDTLGQVWSADTRAQPSAFLLGNGFTYARSLSVTTDNSVPTYAPATLFTSERWTGDKNNGQRWAFPLEAGRYEVRLYFAEIYPGAYQTGARVFDIYLEDSLVQPQFDAFATGGANQGTMLSFEVESDTVLNLQLWPRVQNPALKAIEVLPCSTNCGGSEPTNTAPSVDAGTDRIITLGTDITLSPSISDDGLPAGALGFRWSSLSGPGAVTFSEVTARAPSVSFSSAGTYVLQLRVSDGELAKSDRLTIVVTDSAPSESADFSTVNGRVTLDAERYSRDQSTTMHHWVVSSDAAAEGGRFVVTTPDQGALKRTAAGSPMLAYEVLFEEAGLYYVWVRGWGDTDATGEGKSDSLHVGLNGAIAPAADKLDQFPPGWHWSNHTRDTARATLTVPTPGVHELNLFMREDGLKVDTVVLTKDPDWRP